MKPIEVASRAYVNAGSGEKETGRTTYDQFHERDQRDADKAMEVALLALAKATISRNDAAINGPIGHRTVTEDRIEIFRSILRSIANDREGE